MFYFDAFDPARQSLLKCQSHTCHQLQNVFCSLSTLFDFSYRLFGPFAAVAATFPVSLSAFPYSS